MTVPNKKKFENYGRLDDEKGKKQNKRKKRKRIGRRTQN
jgi:hypothetical protein